MTISSSNNKINYAPDGVQLVFAYNFRVDNAVDMLVYLDDVPVTTGWTIDGLGDPQGGNVTFSVAPVGDVLTLLREVPYTQETDYTAYDPFPAETHEDALDKLTMETQQLSEIFSRTFVAPPSDDGTTSFIIPPYDPSTVLQWDSVEKKLISGSLPNSSVPVNAVFDTVADFLAYELDAGNLIQTKGYYAPGDEGGAVYLIETPAEYGGVADEYGDHTLLNGNIAVLQLVNNIINVGQFGAVRNGASSDNIEAQAAITYGEALTGDFLISPAVGIFFPHRKFLLTGLVCKTNNMSFYSEPGRGAVLISATDSAHVLLKIGDDTYATQTYHINITNLTFQADSTIADRTDTTAIEAHDCISARIENCTFNNWHKSIDGYRLNTSVITRNEFRQHNRTAASIANSAIALNGRSTDGLTSGGNHIVNNEMLGSSITANAVYTANIRVDSADGLYAVNNHMYKALNNVLFSPSGTNLGNMVAAILFSNNYFDQPSERCVRFEGSVADLTGSGGTDGKYQTIVFDGNYFRGGAVGDSGVIYAPYLVSIVVDSVGGSLTGISFTSNRFRQAGINAFAVSGSSSGKVNVDGLVISGNTFQENRQAGVSNYSAFSGEMTSITFSGNTILADANLGAKLAQIVVASGDSCIVEGNNCGKASFTDVDPFLITVIKGVRVQVSDNLLPNVGRTIYQNYAATTVDATPINIFTYSVPTLSSGFIRAKVLGRGLSGTRVINYEFAGAFRDVGAGAVWVTPDPATERNVSINPSTAVVALQITGQDVEVQVTGLAAETIEWMCQVEMTAE